MKNERRERTVRGKARCLQPAGKDGAFSNDQNGLIWFKKVHENSLAWQKLFSMSCNFIKPGLAFTRRMKWKSEHVICFVYYPQQHMISLVSFCCKIWVPWTFHALRKNLPELIKHFSTSITKGIIETIQELSHLLNIPTADDKPSRPLVRLQTCHPGPQQRPWSPGAPAPLWVPEHRRGADTPREAPGYLAWKELAGTKLSGHEWVWSETFPWL